MLHITSTLVISEGDAIGFWCAYFVLIGGIAWLATRGKPKK